MEIIDLTNEIDDISEVLEVGKSTKRHSPTSAAADLGSTQPVAVLEADGATRRSKRQVASTIVYVNGQPIKKDNLYEVKGTRYVYSSSKDLPETNPSKRTSSNPKKKATASNTRKAPPSVSAKERNRILRKNNIADCIRKKSPARNKFLRDNAEILRPFLAPSVFENLIAASNVQAVEPSSVQMQPDMISAVLRDYQLIGLDWMSKMYRKNIGMILGDEMGLGKTLQTISLIAHLKEIGEINGPNLVLCPLSVLDSWCIEIKKWAPSLKFLQFHHSAADRNTELPDFDHLDIIVTTYEMVKVPTLANSIWHRQTFHLLILDEGHRIKCADTQISQAVRKIRCENRLILTGTPLANNLLELWSLLDFLMPGLFTIRRPFEEAFDLTLNVVDRNKLEEAHRMLDLFMIRRMKTEVEKLLPKKIETKVTCPLSSDQIWWYKALLLKDMNILARGEAATHQVLNNLVMQLRKCCLHPFLFPGAENIDETTLDQLVGASGKLTVLDMLLRSLYQKNHRVVLFSQFTQMLDILEDYCALRGWDYCRFDGGTPRAQRNFTVKMFNEPGSRKFIFLMSTRSGGMGINLQTADTCILYDSDWNPQPDIQSMARVHRIGQTKTVHVYRLVTEGTVEQRIVERAEKKLFLDRVVMHGGNPSAASDDVGDDQPDGKKLFHALKFGCNAVFGADQKNQLPSNEDIDIITDRNRTEDFSQGNLKGAMDSNAQDFDATKAFSSTSNFGGIDFAAVREQYKAAKKVQSVAEMSEIFQKRRRMNRIKLVQAAGSGWGSASVPILAMNDYELESGERSVFDQELRGKASQTTYKKKKIEFDSQSHCQTCGDGGHLVLCRKCPISVHLKCCGLTNPKHFMFCSHHRCVVCDKSASLCGGMLFPCNACPSSFCEDHLPAEAKFILGNERVEKLGYIIKHGVYIHCSPQCERYAVHELDFTPAKEQGKPPCPDVLDVRSFFGSEVDESLAAPVKYTTVKSA